MKTIAKSQNVAGTFYALVELSNGNGLVYVQKHNYNGRVRGGMTVRWFCCALTARQSGTDFQKMAREGLPMDQARAMFEKKLKGKGRG
jgi:hypothetical protein